MKRTSLLLSIAFLAFVTLSQTGAGAINRTFAERFETQAKAGDSGLYAFDKAHSFIGFKVKHSGLIDVPGFFRDFTGAVNFDSADMTKSSVEFTAMATSVDTGVKGRDDHLRRADFFEVEKFPELRFKSTKVEKVGNNWMMTGDFTLRGVTKSITFPFQIAGWLPADERHGGKMGITAQTNINRRDYGVNYSTNAMLSDEVKIDLQIEAVKKKEAPKVD